MQGRRRDRSRRADGMDCRGDRLTDIRRLEPGGVWACCAPRHFVVAAQDSSERGVALKSSFSRYWPTYLAILAVLAATLLDWYWVWGIVFLIWSIRALIERETTLIQDVSLDEAPALFWMLTVLWFSLSILMIAHDVMLRIGGINV